MKSNNMWDRGLGGVATTIADLQEASPEPRAEQAHKKTLNAPSNVGARCDCIPNLSKLELLKPRSVLRPCGCVWKEESGLKCRGLRLPLDVDRSFLHWCV